VTGSLGDEKAVECLKLGAADFVLKGHLARLPVAISNALRERKLQEERKQAEVALRESENRLASIISSAMDAIITVDEEHRIVLFNAAAEKIFGYTAMQTIGQPLDRLLQKGFHASHDEQVPSFGETGVTNRSISSPRELWAMRSTGAEFPIEATISQVMTSGKKFFTVILRDVTERKRAVAMLHEQAQALDLSQVIVRDTRGEIVLWTKGAQKLYGFTGKQAVGRISHKLLRTEFPEPLEQIERNLKDREVWEGEVIQHRRDGSRIVVSSMWLLYRDTEGRPTRVLEASTDITLRRRAEEELIAKAAELARQAEELERSNRDLEQFAYVASHDLQEPLRMVAAYTQLLAERYRGKLDENADKYIAYAVEGAVRMQALIRDMLAFSRVGRNGKHRGNTDCNAVVAEAMLNLRAAIEESGALVTHDPLPTVAADRTQLGQLFQNLIGNAIKFRGKEKPAIRVSADRQGGEWVFSVADNGIGIAPEHKDVIFVIFQRLHAREEYSGNGVGLAICKKIVEHHGGRIWVESEPGQGCTFRFTLPARSADDLEEAHDLLQTCNSVGG
jgi:PAS domain S-box-containing protein